MVVQLQLCRMMAQCIGVRAINCIVAMPQGVCMNSILERSARRIAIIAAIGLTVGAMAPVQVHAAQAAPTVAAAPAMVMPAAIGESAAVSEAIAPQIATIQAVFPEGMAWPVNAYPYINYPIWPVVGMGCSSYSMRLSDYIFGVDTPVTRYETPSAYAIQVGDVVRIAGQHNVFVVNADEETITVCEGNYEGLTPGVNAGIVHYGRVFSRASLEGNISYIARRVAQ